MSTLIKTSHVAEHTIKDLEMQYMHVCVRTHACTLLSMGVAAMPRDKGGNQGGVYPYKEDWVEPLMYFIQHSALLYETNV